MNFEKIFPTLAKKRWIEVDLDAEARAYFEHFELAAKRYKQNPFLDAELSEKLVQWIAQKNKVDFSYGGYLEDRGFLNADSYMQKDERFLHLGIDYNVPAGTAIASPVKAIVDTIDDDFPDQCGWGPRVILVSRDSRVPENAVIFGHLRDIQVCVGDIVESGTILAEVGAPPTNGNWFPHLHLQCVEGALYRQFVRSAEVRKIDGYALRAERALAASQYPDPLFLQQI